MKRLINYLIGFLTSIGFTIGFTALVIFFVSFGDLNWFRKEYSKYNVYENVKISQEDLDYVTIEMKDFLMSKRGDLNNIKVNINNVEREFFNEVEKIHMEDVRIIFKAINNLGIIGSIIAGFGIVYFMILNKRGVKTGFSLGIPLCIIGLSMLVLMGTGYYFMNSTFSTMFITFHEILFTNDFWILDPSTSLLINIVPQGFFFDTAIKMAIGLVFVYIGVFALGLILCIIKKRHNVRV